MSGPALGVFLFLLASPPAATTATAERLDFRVRILPLLTKAGCNSGACHGAATGQGGFHLSLLGYDPEADHAAITRELRGRRIDLERPEQSLLLRKPLRLLPHRGGRRIQPDSSAHQTLARWLAAGAPYGSRDLRVARLEAAPREALLAEAETVEIKVTAVLTDGTREDATALALYTANDDAVAEVDAAGRVTALRPGLTSIMIRHGGEVEAVRVAIPFPVNPSSEEAFAAFTPRNSIDERILAELRRLRVPPSPLSEDAEFLRRVHLDLTGRLPSAAEARAFLEEPPSAEKRDRLIDRLLGSEGFIDLWTLRLAELFLAGGRRASDAVAAAEHRWLREQVARNAPFDRTVRELLAATGDAKEVGPAGFFLLASDPRDLAEAASDIFLATRIGCARCHAHPADRWTQDDHLAFAAYFAGVERDGDSIRVAGHGRLEDPRTGKPVAPRPLGGPALAKPPGAGDAPGGDAETGAEAGAPADARRELASWLTSPGNPFFARAITNRIWKHLLGRGLVEPADDLRSTNPPSHPTLLDALAADFAAGGHDLRRLIGTIARSRTYQLSCRAVPGNERDDRLFARAYLKPLAAQVLLDAIVQLTEVPEAFAGHAEGTRAVELASARAPSLALDILGRCPRERSCETAGRGGGGFAQALHLLNGSTINSRLGTGAIASIRARGLAPREAVSELYLRAFSRHPDPEEIAAWEPLLAVSRRSTPGPEEREPALEDLLWALLNSREFVFNH